MDAKELENQVALSLVPGVGNVMGKHLIAHFGSAGAVFDATKAQLLRISGVGQKIAQSILTFDRKLGQKEMEQVNAEQAKLLFYHQADYPNRLKRLMDSPYVFYQKGTCDLNAQKTIAIVGTRKASEYGKEVVDHLLDGLASIGGLVVVSGLAYGIDIHAHKGCLSRKIPTIAVMANGIDMVYPAQHAPTARRIAESAGALITEQPIGAKPDAPKFPERNRIIAGLSDAVLVVEAAESGGALITAHFALDYHVPVYAVPGSIFSETSKGCNSLLASNKAQLLKDIRSLIKDLGWDTAASEQHPTLPSARLAQLGGDAQIVYQALGKAPQHIDTLCLQTGLDLSKLASTLLELEFDGLVKSLPGKRFARAG